MAATKDTNMQQDRQKALENAMKQITKEFGAGSIMRLGEMGDKLDIEVIPTGSLALDIAVGVGGYPRGRVRRVPARRCPAGRSTALSYRPRGDVHRPGRAHALHR